MSAPYDRPCSSGNPGGCSCNRCGRIFVGEEWHDLCAVCAAYDALTPSEKLRALIAKATDEDLTDGGRYFHESCDDLTKCGHGDTGEYQHSADGELIEFLWNNRVRIAEVLS